MARSKIDGVIEAVRYTPDGKIDLARGYERKGAVWTDNLLLSRNELMDLLKKGKRIVTGVRKEYLGGDFTTGKPIQVKDNYILTDDQDSKRDMLTGVGIF